mmetsp:Transcript_40539/g.53357  ORF Transcript_40539/g.53357 Transcript_40539/m.53357 type:complete len:641 (-) Transcript_40539:24-1946(-)
MGSGASRAFASSVYWKIDKLRLSPVFNSISDEHIQDFASCFHVVKFNVGQINLASDKMYYIADGEIQIFLERYGNYQNSKTKFDLSSTQNKLSDQVDLGLKGAGDFLHPIQTKNESIHLRKDELKFFCTKPTICLRLVKKSLKNLSNLIAHQNADKVLVSTINFLYNDIYHILKHIPFLEQASALQMKIVADMCQCATFDPKTKIYARNDESDHFYIILRGMCSIRSAEQYEIVTPLRKSLVTRFTREATFDSNDDVEPEDSSSDNSFHKHRMVTAVAEGPEEYVMTLIKAGIFGFADMVFGIPRICSVFSESEMVLMKISNESLQRYCNLFTEADELVKVTAYEKLLFRLKRLGIPIMSGFPEKYFPQIANFCALMQWKKGQLIIKSGDLSSASVFVVLAGEVDVSTTSAKKEISNGASIMPSMKNHRLRRGSSIGEDVLFTPRSAKSVAVVAKTDCVLLKIQKESEQAFNHDTEAFAQYEICIRKNRCKIKSILDCEKGLYYFKIFLKNFNLDQCIHFIEEVNHLKKLFKENPKTLHTVMIGLIISTYINEGSANKVPLKKETRIGVEVAAQQGIAFDQTLSSCKEPSADIFDVAVQELTHKLKAEYFASFKSSKYFEEMLNSFTSEKWKNVSFDKQK